MHSLFVNLALSVRHVFGLNLVVVVVVVVVVNESIPTDKNRIVFGSVKQVNL